MGNGPLPIREEEDEQIILSEVEEDEEEFSQPVNQEREQ